MTLTIEFKRSGLEATMRSRTGKILWARRAPYRKEAGFWRDVLKAQREWRGLTKTKRGRDDDPETV